MLQSNLNSYDGVEDLRSFQKESFKAYCDDKLLSCERHVHFIKKQVQTSSLLDVCEIGSGNSKLLYLLEKKRMLHKGVGYEVSKSRWKFAEAFKTYMNSTQVTNLCRNILEDATVEEMFDVIIGVDVVFQIIAPLSDTAAEELTLWMKKHLKRDGIILLEFMNCHREKSAIMDKQNRDWSAFSETDPFQFMLTETSYQDNGDILFKKKFIPRTMQEIRKMNNVIRPYEETDAIQFFKKYGFESTIYHCYESVGDIDEEEYILVLRIPK